MANNCYSQYTYHTTIENLESLKSFNKFISDNYNLTRIVDYLKELDLTDEQIRNMINDEDYRDEVFGCSDIETKTTEDGKELYYFTVDAESAWVPHPRPFQIMKDRDWSGINMEVYSEEPGCDLFINTDTEGIFNPTRYRVFGYYCNWGVDSGNEFEEYFETKEEIARFLNSEIESDRFTADMDIYEMEKVADSILSDKYDTSSVSVYEFETDISDYTSAPEINV